MREGLVAFGDLPPAVRRTVLVWSAAALGAMSDAVVPAALRKVRGFTPARRATAGAAALTRALGEDRAFRAAVAAAVPTSITEPSAVAGAAWLRAEDGLDDALAALTSAHGHAEREREVSDLLASVARLERERDAAHARATALADELAAVRADTSTRLDEAKRRVRPLQQRLDAAERERDDARAEAQAAAEGAAAQRVQLQGEADRLRAELARVAADLAGARAATGASRAALDRRTSLLLETVLGAAQGLQRELAPAGDGPLPGDVVVAGVRADARAVGRADLDALLALPRVHLLVDGYNVTKGAYGTLALEEQRARLLSGAGALAARTGAEITVVFDGQGRVGPAVVTPRGVRVVFTDAGQLADDVVLAFLSAEPEGRAVVVVSSDKEVAAGARARGAWSLPSAELAARLW